MRTIRSARVLSSFDISLPLRCVVIMLQCVDDDNEQEKLSLFVRINYLITVWFLNFSQFTLFPLFLLDLFHTARLSSRHILPIIFLSAHSPSAPDLNETNQDTPQARTELVLSTHYSRSHSNKFKPRQVSLMKRHTTWDFACDDSEKVTTKATRKTSQTLL